MIRIYNSMTGAKQVLQPLEPGHVRMYCCGTTVYDYFHVGNARMLVVFDMVSRYLRYRNLRVTFVRNITDVDDKIIRRAAEEGIEWRALADRYTMALHADLLLLGCLPPDKEPRASSYIPEMLTMIGQLIARGYAYVANNGDVMYAVRKFAGYGRLSGKRLEDLQAGARVEVDLAKRDPLDFVLWKSAKPEEPSWPSPWGPGRPGWHIECSAMSTHELGNHFDIHGGGLDLKFPHHENERAQAVAMGKTFANHWMHHQFVVDAEGEKLSKSLGNFTNLLDLIDTMDPRSYRMLLLQSHYRSPVQANTETVGAAERALTGLDTFVRRAAASGASGGTRLDEVARAFARRMDDDLDTAGAMAIVFDAARRGNAAIDAGDLAAAADLAATVEDLCSAVGLRLSAAGEVPAEMVARAAALDAARAAKDFAAADAIRAELQDAGWVVETAKTGTTVRRS
ncbi:MAG: cysteine--tRNA ligase [Pseudomonadales bacterium]|nr:cysteine--tRNA ligase [Pseudomonadales bacterium]